MLIICHSEKPPDRAAVHLNLKGQERALAPFLTQTPELIRYGLPVALFATKIAADDPSLRSQETITPLARQLQLPIQAIHIDKEYEQSAQHLLA